MDWLDLLAVQGTLKSLLQHHSSKAPILQRSAFFTVQLSRLYMSIGRTMTLTRRTFVSKVMCLCSLLFVVQLPSRVRPFLTPWTAARRASTAPPQTRLSPWKAWKELGFILGAVCAVAQTPPWPVCLLSGKKAEAALHGVQSTSSSCGKAEERELPARV